MSAIYKPEIWASTDALAWFWGADMPVWTGRTAGWIKLAGFGGYSPSTQSGGSGGEASKPGIADGIYHCVTPSYLAWVALRVRKATESPSVSFEKLSGAVAFVQDVIRVAGEIGVKVGTNAEAADFARSGMPDCRLDVEYAFPLVP